MTDELEPGAGTYFCERCGQTVRIGEWPFCGGKNKHGYPSGGIQPDSFGSAGQWIENLGVEPVWVTGRQDLKAKAAERGLRWVPEGVTNTKDRAYDDSHGRYNGGRSPEFRERHRPAPELPKGHPGTQ